MLAETPRNHLCCDVCYEKNNKDGFVPGTLKCELHSEILPEKDLSQCNVIYGVIYKEAAFHQSFEGDCFTCDVQKLPPIPTMPDYQCPYLPEDLQHNLRANDKVKGKNYNTRPKKYTEEAIAKSIDIAKLTVPQAIMYRLYTDPSCANLVLVTKSDNICVLWHALRTMRITPDHFRMTGSKFSFLRIEQANITIVGFENYFPGRLHDLLASYGCDTETSAFPAAFSQPSNFEYNGPVPELGYWTSPKDNAAKKAALQDVVDNIEGDWNFAEELAKSSQLKCLQFIQVICQFTSQCYRIQKSLGKADEATPFVHPFQVGISSISSFSYKLFSDHCLSKMNLMTVKSVETGVYTEGCSLVEYQYSMLLRERLPNSVLHGSFLSANGQFKGFKPIGSPDIYDETEGRAYWLHGCAFHPCVAPDCKVTNDRNKMDKSSKAYLDAMARIRSAKSFDDQVHRMKTKHPNLMRKVEEVVYECHFNTWLTDTPEGVAFQARLK